MTTASVDFKRILVELHHTAPGPSMRLAAELAALLRLDLLGLFVQEEILSELANLPFAREFRPLGGWRRIELHQLSQDLDLAARRAERAFTQAARGLDTPWHFEIVKGSMVDTIEAKSRGGDIVMVAESASPADRATRPSAPLVEAAFRSASAVMLAPKQVARSAGVIMAIAASPSDPCIAAAAAIAARAQEGLLILQAFEPGQAVAKSSGNSRISIRSVPTAARELSHAGGISSAFRAFNERLVVMTRGAFDEPIPSIIASVRHDPVLIIAGNRDEGSGSGRRFPS